MKTALEYGFIGSILLAAAAFLCVLDSLWPFLTKIGYWGTPVAQHVFENESAQREFSQYMLETVLYLGLMFFFYKLKQRGTKQ